MYEDRKGENEGGKERKLEDGRWRGLGQKAEGKRGPVGSCLSGHWTA